MVSFLFSFLERVRARARLDETDNKHKHLDTQKKTAVQILPIIYSIGGFVTIIFTVI